MHLSCCSIVSKWLNISSYFLQHTVVHYSSFPSTKHCKIPKGALNAGGIYEFCDFLLVYGYAGVENDTSYYGMVLGSHMHAVEP